MPEESKRVLQLVQTMEMGGLERVVANLSGALRQVGWHVDLACLSHSGVMATKECYDHLWEGHLSQTIKPLDFLCLFRLCRYIRKECPAVIHSHNPQALLYGFLASWITGVPHVHTVHGRGGENAGGEGRKARIRRLAARRGVLFVAVSSDIYRKLTQADGVPLDSVTTILNGVDTGRFHSGSDAVYAKEAVGLPPDSVVAGSVGRLSPEKNYTLLIRAFAKVVNGYQLAVDGGGKQGARYRLPWKSEKIADKRASGVRLLLVGDGPDKAVLQGEVARLGINEYVLFPGAQADVLAWLRAMDVFCLSSDSEGTPVALLEGGAMGLPAIVTRVGGCPEIVKNGENGYVVDVGDVENYAVALSNVCGDQGKRSEMGRAARRQVEQSYSLRMTVDSYVALYGRAMGGV